MEKTSYDKKKEMLVELMQESSYKPLKLKELSYFLQVTPEDREIFTKMINELVNEGKIEVTAKGKYQKASSDLLSGVFEGHQKGYGFVSIEGEKDDVFIPEEATHGALHKDRVLIKITDSPVGKRREGIVEKIVERGFDEIVGTYQKSKNFGFVVPDNTKYNKDIFVPKSASNGAVTGHKVVVKITDFGSLNKKPEGKIIEIIGHIDDPGTDIMSVVKAYDLPVDFPKLVERQLKDIPDEVDSKAYAGRMDIRDWQTVTIDGEDAKDLDDAITIKKCDDRYVLGVHIADVTNYVTEGSPLDVEALKRGTSVYLVDRVIPMLPHKLSNGICSLNQGVDRLALSCIMEVDFNGKVIGHKIAETVVNIDRRMSYTSVKKIIEDEDKAEIEEYKELVPMFHLMKELADILREKRKQRGSIDFDFPESKIELDSKGKPTSIHAYERNSATKIIEDFMLLANETIAEDYFWQELPFEYRTHEAPDPEKIDKLSVLINNFGYYLKVGNDEIHPKEFQKLLAKIEGMPEEPLISRLTLRSMKQARYTTVCSGHFGLSTKYYCHFTSPIRRYPDLQIHRIIKENLHGKLTEKRIGHYERILNTVADANSKCERRADEAEREVEKLKKVDYMSERIGQIYEGVISSITSWGMYVELENTVEGMIHVNSLIDDYYYYDEERYVMVGQDTHREFHLGQKVKIRVKETDKLAKTIDFELYEEDTEFLEYMNKIKKETKKTKE